MSNPLSFYGQPVPLRGVGAITPATAVSLCRQPQQGASGPSTVSISINWSDYINVAGTAAPIAPIEVNLQSTAGAAGAPLDAIRSIKIDNIGGVVPVTVFFPDTLDEIECAPNSTTVQNVLTGAMRFFVFSTLSTGNINRRVTIFACNFMQNPETATSVIAVENFEQATGAPFSLMNLAAHSLGDRFQRAEVNLTLTGVASQIALFGGPPNGYNSIVISGIRAQTLGNYTDQTSPLACNITLVNELATVFYTFKWIARNDLDDYSRGVLITDNPNLQLPFDSQISASTSHKYFLQNNVASLGINTFEICYTLVNNINF